MTNENFQIPPAPPKPENWVPGIGIIDLPIWLLDEEVARKLLELERENKDDDAS